MAPTTECCYSTVMLSESVHDDGGAYVIAGRDAASIARSVEDAVIRGALRPGETTPSIRRLAARLGTAPSTVAAAYRELRRRGVLVSHDRTRTVVAHRPPLATRLAASVPDDAVDLTTGNPDPRLLPDLAPAIAALPARHHQYGDAIAVDELLRHARGRFIDDGVHPPALCITSGGLDAIERILSVHLTPGDRVAVEDPTYAGSLDLVRAQGLVPEPVAIDDEGMRPEALAHVLERGARAVLVTPRGQNPTGASLGADRADELARLLGAACGTVLLVDDHLSGLAEAPLHLLMRDQPHWAVIRSVAKWLGPGLRAAVVATDEDTAARVLGRQRLGTGWVPQLLQHLIADTWRNAERDGVLESARERYRERREALLAGLADHDVAASGAHGLNVWVPVPEEAPVVQGLAEKGWAVLAGAAYRLDAPPGVRITTAALEPRSAPQLAADVAEVLGRTLTSRRG